MIRINLLPVREARRRAGLRQQGILLGGALGMGVVAALALHLSVQARISSTRSYIGKTQNELATLQKTLGDVEDFRKKKGEIERKLSVISELERSRRGPVRVLDEIAIRKPERLWLTNLSLRNGVLELTGYGMDNEVIAAFMTTLGQSRHLRNVELLETKLENQKGLKLNRFRIRSRETASFRPPKSEDTDKAKRKRGRGRGRGKRRR